MIWHESIIWWGLVVSALAMWLPQNVQHEGMHAALAKYFGADDVKIWPFPGKQLGHFTWAHARWRWTKPVTVEQEAYTAIAPLLANTFVIFLVMTILSAVETSSVVFTVMTAWAVVNFIDGGYSLLTFYKKVPEKPRSDGWVFTMKHPGTTPFISRFLAVSWHIAFAVQLFSPSVLESY